MWLFRQLLKINILAAPSRPDPRPVNEVVIESLQIICQSHVVAPLGPAEVP